MLPTVPSPAQLCQACFALATCGVLAVAACPPRERQLLLRYGARASTTGDGRAEGPGGADKERRRPGLAELVAHLTSLGRVPHAWFGSFYGLYLASAAFWALQLLGGGHALRLIAARQRDAHSPPLPSGQLAVAWALMLAQAARRLYEHVAVLKPSRSKMWFVHWLLGLVFYETMSVAVWVDGSDALLRDAWAWEASWQALAKMGLGAPAFLSAWAAQYKCHRYLAGLEKYSLPDEGMFRSIVCPHYTCECLLYLSLAVVAAPEGQLLSRPVLCAVVFVAVNLGVTARETARWYGDRFGREKVAGRSLMIPFVY